MSVASKNKGFVAISVLLITTVSTILAVSAIQENRLQERISGNQIKEVNARSKAEQGIFDSYEYIQTQQANGFSAASISALLSSQSVSDKYALSADFNATENSILITSEGQYQGAKAYLRAEVVVVDEVTVVNEGTGSSGVIACDSISLTAGGVIDSFDSSQGIYSNSTATSNANVMSINGDMNISGGVNLKGDLTVNGNITQSGSATLGGDVAASGNITLAQATVEGNVSSGGNISLTGGTIGDSSVADSGNVSSVGTLTLANGSESTVSATGTGTVNANGGLITPSWFGQSHFDNFSTDISESGASAPTMASNECDQLDIANAFPTIDADDTSDLLNDSPSGNVTLTINDTVATGFNDGSALSPLTGQTSTLWDGNESVYVFEDMNLNNTMITIEGDITIMVTGDLTTSGGNSGFQFNDGDTTSSLTLLVEGQVNIGSSGQLFADATIDSSSQESPLTIYSSFDSSGSNDGVNAILLNGNTEMYAQVYAPLGDVEFAASGEMMGSLEGKNIKISGSGDIHYDEALPDIGGSSTDTSTGTDSVTFNSIYYHYPN